MRRVTNTYTVPSPTIRNEILESVDGLTEFALSTVGLCGDLTCGEFLDTSEIHPTENAEDTDAEEISFRDDSTVSKRKKKDKKNKGFGLPGASWRQKSAYHVMNSRGYFDVVDGDKMTENDRKEAQQARRYFMGDRESNETITESSNKQIQQQSVEQNRKTFWPRSSTTSTSSKGRKKKQKHTIGDSSPRSRGTSSRNRKAGPPKAKTGLRQFLEDDEDIHNNSSFEVGENREDPPSVDRYASLSDDEQERVPS